MVSARITDKKVRILIRMSRISWHILVGIRDMSTPLLLQIQIALFHRNSATLFWFHKKAVCVYSLQRHSELGAGPCTYICGRDTLAWLLGYHRNYYCWMVFCLVEWDTTSQRATLVRLRQTDIYQYQTIYTTEEKEKKREKGTWNAHIGQTGNTYDIWRIYTLSNRGTSLSMSSLLTISHDHPPEHALPGHPFLATVTILKWVLPFSRFLSFSTNNSSQQICILN